jgi:hypothetical protein
MPKSRLAQGKHGDRSSRGSRNTTTLVHMPMDPEQQKAVAARVKELRGLRPQPQMAAEVGVSLRAYQEWEAGGGIKWSNLQRLAEVHGVTPNYILYGDEEPRGPKTQLDRMEAMLEEILAAVRKKPGRAGH